MHEPEWAVSVFVCYFLGYIGEQNNEPRDALSGFGVKELTSSIYGGQ